MSHIIIEIKAKCTDPGAIRDKLKKHQARFSGVDHQIDTYFQVKSGRLKIRQGTIENNLIFYHRADRSGPKKSEVYLYNSDKGNDDLRALLLASLGEKVTVDKHREIYFIDNVKFHIDEVKGLGSYIEIEAIDINGDIGENILKEQCDRYIDIFGINPSDLITCSYSDMLQKLPQED